MPTDRPAQGLIETGLNKGCRPIGSGWHS